MDYEASLNKALDLLADGEDAKAHRILQAGIDHVKTRLAGKAPAETPPLREEYLHYYWGRFLTAMEEPEQALLKFEKALKINPGQEGSLWETASLLLHELDKPELAKRLLSEKLLVLFPANPLYREALAESEFLLRVRQAPPDPGEAEPA